MLNTKITLTVLFVLTGINCSSQIKINRIISLAPSLTKSLYYLEADKKIIGHTSFCHIAQNDHKEIVASAVKVNIEKVIRLRPDLVVATTITHPETVEILRKAGLRVELFSTPKSFDEICSQFERLGNTIGNPGLAKKIVLETRQAVNAIAKQASRNKRQPRVFFQIGAEPLYAVLDNTFLNDYITFTGGQNIASGLTIPTLTREFVLSKNPDVIIIVTMGMVGTEEKQRWERFTGLNAVKNKHVFIIDSDIACVPTPVDFRKTLEIIQEMQNQ